MRARASSAAVSGGGFVDQVEAGRHERQAREVVEHAEALLALADHVLGAVAGGEVADDARDGADGVQVLAASARPPTGSFCMTRPMRRPLRAASSAAASEIRRPIVSGMTAPGNTTVFRTGRMMSTSSGTCCSSGFVGSFSLSLMLVSIRPLGLHQLP